MMYVTEVQENIDAYNELMENTNENAAWMSYLSELDMSRKKAVATTNLVKFDLALLSPMVFTTRRTVNEEKFLSDVFAAGKDYFANMGKLIEANLVLRKFINAAEASFGKFNSLLEEKDNLLKTNTKPSNTPKPKPTTSKPTTSVTLKRKSHEMSASGSLFDATPKLTLQPLDEEKPSTMESEQHEVDPTAYQMDTTTSHEIDINDLFEPEEKPTKSEPVATVSSSSNFYFPVSTYSTGQRYACKFCKFTSLRRSSVIAHMKTHASPSTPVLPRIVEGGLKEYQVDVHVEQPGEDEDDDRDISENGYKIVSGEKRFECEYCGYRTKKVNHVKTHVSRHRAEKNLECEYCDYRSVCRTDLRRHVRRAHMDDELSDIINEGGHQSAMVEF